MARGRRESSNPAKTTTHSRTVEKETHFINVVGKMLGNNIENGEGTISITTTNGVLVARGGLENSNPAKTTTHSGTVEKETHFINVVGKTDPAPQIDFTSHSYNSKG